MSDKIIYSKSGAFRAQKCPRCHTGDVFTHASYSLKFTEMYENCPVCGQKYEIEPGFFWGSMYISYGFTVLIGLPSGLLAYYLIKDASVFEILGTIFGALLILSPLSFRYSRLIMLYYFASIRFDPEAGATLGE